jgi:hypothetical protein
MANMLLATPILSDAATLSASDGPASLPIGNLQVSAIGRVWRSSDPENTFVQADLGAAKSFDLIAVLGHNGSSRGYARVRAAADASDLLTDPAYDSGNLPLRSHQTGYDSSWASGVDDEESGALSTNHFILKLGAAISYRYVRIDITDTEIEFFDGGRLYISNAFQPSVNIEYGESEGFVDPSTISRAYSGRLIPNERPKYRVAEFMLSFGTKSEMYDALFEIDRLRGATRDVLYIKDPADTAQLQRYTIYGLMKPQPASNTHFSLFEKQFRIEEIIE